MRSAFNRIVLLLAAAAALLTILSPERAPYFCRMMGEVMLEPCCPEHAHDVARCDASIRAADCCERLVAGGHDALVGARGSTPDPSPQAALPPAPPVSACGALATQLAIARPTRGRAPPAIGPPLFILHRALLI